MKITNKNNLPEAIVKALMNDSYNSGDSDHTVTGLLSPPRQRVLKLRHKDEIESDVEDLVYMMYGQIAHGILDRANELDLSEKRFFSEFLGKKVSGQIDTLSLNSGILSDYKFSSVWKFRKNHEPDSDWVAQLNMQLELLRRNGLDANSLQIVGLIRDYRVSEASRTKDYPDSSIVILPIPIWPREQTVTFIEARVKSHEDAHHALPECTPEERWYSPPNPRYKGSGGYKRCSQYCSVNKWCSTYQNELNL